MPLRHNVIRGAAACLVMTAGLMWAPLVTPGVAQAEVGCPSAAASFAAGSGTQGDPWQIDDSAQFQLLRQDAATWDDSFILKADIDMGGCTWNSPIGISALGSFRGLLDGRGHVVSGLDVSMGTPGPSQYAGLIGYLGAGGIVTRIGFAGDVSLNPIRSVGLLLASAGGLVGYVATGATVSYAYATGDVTASIPSPNPSARSMTGGLAGYSAGTITNSYATGNISSASNGQPPQLFSGGLVGATEALPTSTIDNSYATGSQSGSGGSRLIGGFVGSLGAGSQVSGNLWDTTGSGDDTGVGNDASAQGVVGKSTAQLQEFATYRDSGWAIVNGWQPFDPASGAVWGICSGATRAFLLWQFTSHPCPPPPPPPPPTLSDPPRDARATSADGAVRASWQPPESTGSFPVTWYQAVTSPGGRACLTQLTSCSIDGLVNGASYVVTVRALTGAGWSAESAPSNAVTPRPAVAPSLVITGTREQAGRVIRIDGTSTRLAGEMVTMWIAHPGTPATPGAKTARIDADGTFTWSRRASREVRIYATAGDTVSNIVRIAARSR